MARSQPTGWGEAPRPIAGPEGRRVARGPSAIGRLSLHLIAGTGRRSAQTARVRAGAEPGAQVSRPAALVWAARRWVRAGDSWTDPGARAGWGWAGRGGRRVLRVGADAWAGGACVRASKVWRSRGPGWPPEDCWVDAGWTALGMLVPWRWSGAPWANRDGAEPGECLLGRGAGGASFLRCPARVDAVFC